MSDYFDRNRMKRTRGYHGFPLILSLVLVATAGIVAVVRSQHGGRFGREEHPAGAVRSTTSSGPHRSLAEAEPPTVETAEAAPVADRGYRHDFSYDRGRWDARSPRIAVLAGPHRTASSALRTFFAGQVGTTVALSPETTELSDAERERRPHPALDDWVWPVGADAETPYHQPPGDSESFFVLVMFLMGHVPEEFFPGLSEEELRSPEEMREISFYFRALLRRPWTEGRNLVFGNEFFDIVTRDLWKGGGPVIDGGEKTHTAGSSSKLIDRLLGLLLHPGDEECDPSPCPEPLRLEDIEVQINFRSDRIGHLESLWLHAGTDAQFSKYLVDPRTDFTAINSLAEALQFVRRGVKTTLVVMEGVRDKEEREAEETDSGDGADGVVGGLVGVVACDILRMGADDGLCDEKSRLHLPGFVPPGGQEEEPVVATVGGVDPIMDLTDDQREAIDTALKKYDCGIWQHLRKYQDEGTFRVLYAPEDLFSGCDPDGARDIPFRETIDTIVVHSGGVNAMNFVPPTPPKPRPMTKKQRLPT